MALIVKHLPGQHDQQTHDPTKGHHGIIEGAKYSLDELNIIDDGKAYIYTPDGEYIDVYDFRGRRYDGHYDLWKSNEDIKDKYGDWNAFIESGGIRVRETKLYTSIETAHVNLQSLRYLQKLYDKGAFDISKYIDWSSDIDVPKRVITGTLEDFIDAKGFIQSSQGIKFKQQIVIVKHLPGQHDQSTHNPYKKKPKTREEVLEQLSSEYSFTNDPYAEVDTGRFDTSYWERFDKPGPTVVYHGTKKEFVDLIKQYGLKRGGGWMDRPPSVYFTSHRDYAKGWNPTAIIKFKIPDEWDKLVITDAIAMRDFKWEEAFRLERDIPPEYIESIEIWKGFEEGYETIKLKERFGYIPVKCYFTDDEETKRIRVIKGGPGSGNFGHAGRPGKVGGSAPNNSGSINKDVFYPTIGLQQSLVDNATSYPGEDEKITQYLNDGLSSEEMWHWMEDKKIVDYPAWAMASYEDRGMTKDKLVTRLSEETGIDYDTINAIVAQWATSSNDNDMRSLSLQAAAAEEFGLEMGDWQKKSYEEKLGVWTEIQKHRDSIEKEQFDWLMEKRGRLQAQGIDNPITRASLAEIRQNAKDYANTSIIEQYTMDSRPITSRENERKVLRAMYEITQADLASHGYNSDDTIVLWRGIGSQDKGKLGELAYYQGNTIESWSISYKIANDFRSGMGDMVGAHVPVRNILATCKTGFGCLTEGEVVTFGTIPGMQVRVAESIEKYDPQVQQMLLDYAAKKKKQYEDSAMIALLVDNPEVRRLWKELGSSEDVLPLHITILYLGKIANLDKETIITRLQTFANNQAPIEGEYGGAAVFNDKGDMHPIVLLYDSPQLPFAFSKLSGMLKGIRPDLDHGFTPHTTLTYSEKPIQLSINPIPHRFDNVMLQWGNEQITYPLKGDIIEKGGPTSGNFSHAGRPGKVGGSAPSKKRVVSSKYSTYTDSRGNTIYKVEAGQDLPASLVKDIENAEDTLVRVTYNAETHNWHISTKDIFSSDHGDFLIESLEGKDAMFKGEPFTEGILSRGIFQLSNKELTLYDFSEEFMYYDPLTEKAMINKADKVMRKAQNNTFTIYGKSIDVVIMPFGELAAGKEIPIKRIRIIKGGPGSGYFNHPGRPGKVGGSLPRGFEASYWFGMRAELERYTVKKTLAQQGAQAVTQLVEMDGGMPAVKKTYKASYINYATNDAAAYEIAQATGIDNVPMTVNTGPTVSFQRFANNSQTAFDYGALVTDKEVQQLENLTYFDVLIGNQDRNMGNLMMHKDTGKLIFIDNSTSLGDSWANWNESADDFELTVKSIIYDGNRRFTHSDERFPKFSKKRWADFAVGATSDNTVRILQKHYPERWEFIYSKMMGRMRAFERVMNKQGLWSD